MRAHTRDYEAMVAVAVAAAVALNLPRRSTAAEAASNTGTAPSGLAATDKRQLASSP